MKIRGLFSSAGNARGKSSFLTVFVPSTFKNNEIEIAHFDTRQDTKGNLRRSIGHCPHLWNLPLQPIHHSQKSYCLWYKYMYKSHNQGLCCAGWNGCSGDFHRCGQYPMDLLWLPFIWFWWNFKMWHLVYLQGPVVYHWSIHGNPKWLWFWLEYCIPSEIV